MTDGAQQPSDYDVSGDALKALVEKLDRLLRIRTLPVGLKLFADADEMMAIPGVRTPTEGYRFTTCQLVTQSRIHGFTLGIVHDNLRPNSNCGGIVGLNPPGPDYLSGENMAGVWFDNKEAARRHQAEMVRVEPRYNGICVSPLRTGRLDPPDIVLFYATPAQTILFVNGLQWKRYKRYDMSITGESACADSWGKALSTGEPSVSIRCYAERKFGGVQDDEMLVALPPRFLPGVVEGLAQLSRNGLRYPIPNHGIQKSPLDSISKSYG